MLDDDLKNIFKLTIAFRFGRDVPDDWDDRDEIGGEESVVMYHNVLEKLVYLLPTFLTRIRGPLCFGIVKAIRVMLIMKILR